VCAARIAGTKITHKILNISRQWDVTRGRTQNSIPAILMDLPPPKLRTAWRTNFLTGRVLRPGISIHRNNARSSKKDRSAPKATGLLSWPDQSQKSMIHSSQTSTSETCSTDDKRRAFWNLWAMLLCWSGLVMDNRTVTGNSCYQEANFISYFKTEPRLTPWSSVLLD
jgi:hypothetical protein